jgi:uncharacterized protein (DUF1778 family)
MDLWSKGLGKRVLRLRLSECNEMVERDGQLVIRGVMGPPVYWDYAVTLSERDVVEFLEFLKQPAPVRFLVSAGKRRKILTTMVASAAAFAWRTLARFVVRAPAPATVAPPGDAATALERSADGERGS